MRVWVCPIVSRAVWDNATHFPASSWRPLCLSLTSHLAAAQRCCAPHPHPRLDDRVGEGSQKTKQNKKHVHTHPAGGIHSQIAAFVVRGDCAAIDKRRRMESSTGPSPRWAAPPLANYKVSLFVLLSAWSAVGHVRSKLLCENKTSVMQLLV